MTIHRTLAAALTAAAIVAPTAAQARPADMHSSVAQAAAKARVAKGHAARDREPGPPLARRPGRRPHGEPVRHARAGPALA